MGLELIFILGATFEAMGTKTLVSDFSIALDDVNSTSLIDGYDVSFNNYSKLEEKLYSFFVIYFKVKMCI